VAAFWQLCEEGQPHGGLAARRPYHISSLILYSADENSRAAVYQSKHIDFIIDFTYLPTYLLLSARLPYTSGLFARNHYQKLAS
jgi:hypothetical protein